MTYSRELDRRPLFNLCQSLLDGAVDANQARYAIDERRQLAVQIGRVAAANLADHELAERLAYLKAGSTPDPTKPPSVDMAERECVRAQLEAIEHEIARRRDALSASDAPTRADLIAIMLEAGRHTGDTLAPEVREVQQIIEETLLDPHSSSPATFVCEVLDRVVGEGAGEGPPSARWFRHAVAVEMLAERQGYAGVRFHLDPHTRAEALTAKRLLWAAGRDDAGPGALGRPLDMDGLAVAAIVAAADSARAAWFQRGIPEMDLAGYSYPPRREEPGRPPAHPQIRPEAEAREEAISGGLPYPLVYGIDPRDRPRVARYVWSQGLPRNPKVLNSVVLHTAPGDFRVRWDAPLYPFGVLCAARIAEDAILTVGRKGGGEHDEIFNRLSSQASAATRTDEEFQKQFRELLLGHGYLAVARYDRLPDAKVDLAQEIIVLDPEAVTVIRESVPPFTHR
jgi:hypothetical protein